MYASGYQSSYGQGLMMSTSSGAVNTAASSSAAAAAAAVAAQKKKGIKSSLGRFFSKKEKVSGEVRVKHCCKMQNILSLLSLHVYMLDQFKQLIYCAILLITRLQHFQY